MNKIKRIFIPKYLKKDTNILLIRIYLVAIIILILQIVLLLEFKYLKDVVVIW